MSPRGLTISAAAKLNLFLEILGRRPDGYHSLHTIFQQVTLADTLSVRPAPEWSLVSSDTALPTGPENLVLRAAASYKERTGEPVGARFHLTKRVPVGAGLGGGSSDAAAALKACWRLATRKPWKDFPAPRWAAAARVLGADVPFFLRGGCAEGKGIGDELRPLRLGRTYHFVLLFPRLFTSTKEVYKNLHFPLTNRRSCHTLKRALSDGAPPKIWAKWLYNRLEDVALKRWPKIGEARRALEAAGCLAGRMSGSGSAVFGPVESASQGRAVMARLGRKNWDLWLVRSIK